MVLQAVDPGLSSEEMQAFYRNGFHVARGLFGREAVEELIRVFMDMNKDGPVEGLSETMRGEGNPGYDPADPLAFYPRVMHPHNHPELPVGPVATKYMLYPALRPFLRDLFEGDEPVAAQSMFYFKPPGARGQSLHQDNYYLQVKPTTCMAAWVALDDADEENGGIVVVPGSHKMDIACPGKSDSTRFFTSDYVPVPEGMTEQPANLKAGDVLFFNGSLIHGSYPNSSKDRFRRAFICHYLPQQSKTLAKWYKNTVTFEGTRVDFADPGVGGPCGTPQEITGAH